MSWKVFYKFICRLTNLVQFYNNNQENTNPIINDEKINQLYNDLFTYEIKDKINNLFVKEFTEFLEKYFQKLYKIFEMNNRVNAYKSHLFLNNMDFYKNQFIKILEIKISKILSVFHNRIKLFQNENFLKVISYFIVIIKYISDNMDTDKIFFTNNKIKQNLSLCISENIKSKFKSNIAKLGFMLSRDRFDIIPLEITK